MIRTAPGSTGRLLQYCFGYFASYTVFGVAVKYFQEPVSRGFPGMNGTEWLLYSSVGGTLVALFVCLGLGWVRMRTTRRVAVGPWRVPVELAALVPSGICTAVVIPTTTLMYSLPVSVLVAMVVMRGSILVVSRIVDAIQIRQGLLRKRVLAEENWGVVFALLAVAVHVFWTPELARALGRSAAASPGGSFEFLRSGRALGILGVYIAAYALRIYIMNWFKNTRPAGAPLDDRGYFAVEQMVAFATLVVVVGVLLAVRDPAPGSAMAAFQAAVHRPHPQWLAAAFAGTSFGIVAIFSVFLFLFQGRTATFAGLVNRVTSLVAGTASTLLFAILCGGRYPDRKDWVALGFLLVAVGFSIAAERRRRRTPA